MKIDFVFFVFLFFFVYFGSNSWIRSHLCLMIAATSSLYLDDQQSNFSKPDEKKQLFFSIFHSCFLTLIESFVGTKLSSNSLNFVNSSLFWEEELGGGGGGG